MSKIKTPIDNEKEEREEGSALLNLLYAEGLTSQDFRGMDFSKSALNEFDIENADFSHSDLKLADFNGADLESADFSYSDVRGADFRTANLKNTNFENANTAGTLFSTEELEADNNQDINSIYRRMVRPSRLTNFQYGTSISNSNSLSNPEKVLNKENLNISIGLASSKFKVHETKGLWKMAYENLIRSKLAIIIISLIPIALYVAIQLLELLN